MKSVHIALSAGGHSIQPATDRALLFQGEPSANIPQGEVVVSDPIEFELPPLTNLAVTIYFGKTSASVTGHPGSRTTSYIQPGDAVNTTNLPDAVETAHWYILTGIDVVGDGWNAAVVTLGDSITDGRGSTTDENNRWPDNLAQRLNTNQPTANVAVINQGIGGNTVLAGGLGPTALSRFDRDVLEARGVRWLILFEGVNDIGGSKPEDSLTVATNLIAAFGRFIDKAHAKNIRVYGATITPFGRSFYDSPAHETARQMVNDWVRTSGRFDAVIDFDAAVRDPANLANLLPAYDSGDHLHLGVAGYQHMADIINLEMFKPQP